VHKAESVVNLTGNRTGVLLLSKLFLAAGVGLLSSSIAAAANTDGRVTAMLAAAIACGYVYQGPPFRYAQGLLHCVRLTLEQQQQYSTADAMTPVPCSL
jgi:1,4-dihydroxy-2-naphthoate octaprenyltransferase